MRQVDLEVAHLHHYRRYCVDNVENCEEEFLTHQVGHKKKRANQLVDKKNGQTS